MGKLVNTPKLRFSEFEGEWEKKKLGEASIKVGDGLHGTPVYSENSDIYFINGNNLIDGKVVISNTTKKVAIETYVKNNKGLNENTLLISINGTIGNVSRYANEKVMLGKSVGYYVFNQECSFYYHLLRSDKVQNLFISELTGSTIKNLSLKTLRETEVLTPNIPEQIKIAKFHTSVDDKLTQLNKKKSLLEQYKKGVMQKLFSQELRFKDENGNDFAEWEDRKLGDLFVFNTTNSFSRDNLNYEAGSVKNIHYGDIHTKFQSHFDVKKELVPFINDEISLQRFTANNYCQEGDLIVADASEDYADIGKAIEIVNLNNEKVIAGLHTLHARPNLDKLAIGFSGHLMKSENVRLQIKTQAQGTKVLSITTGRLAQINIKLPCITEQTKIANFLSAIDDKINHCVVQIEKMEVWKKGLLQQMFV